MKKTTLYGLAVLLTISLSGCMLPSQQRSLSDVNTKVDTLEKDMAAIKERTESSSKFLAESTAEGDSMRREFDHLRGMVEEREHRLAKSEEAIELLKSSIQSIDDQMRKLGKGGFEEASATIEDIKKALDELNGRIEKLEKTLGVKTEGASAGADPKTLYNDGLDTIRNKKNYKKGAEALERFISQYPKHELAGNAQYWIGEAYYALNDFERAIAEFNRVITKYPKSDKVPASLLKQGYAFEKLKETENALIIFKSLVEKHPKSAEAATAKKRITEIEKAQKKKAPAKPKKEGTKSSK